MRFWLALVALSVGALAVAAFAVAKEGARARLTTPLPLGAKQGATVHVGWSVRFPGDDGGRPFDAPGLFVRLLSRTGAPAATGYASATAHPDGRYAADVDVPSGGIGGIRIGGLAGNTDVLLSLDNDPFRSPSGVRCDVDALKRTVRAFVGAYNAGNFARLDSLFSRDGFVWYAAVGPGRALRGAKQNRETLIPYFRERHGHGDHLTLHRYRFNGYDRARDLGHFQFHGERQADDFRGGQRSRMVAKGALDCSRSPVTIALLMLGGQIR